jgi:hypothetical protein
MADPAAHLEEQRVAAGSGEHRPVIVDLPVQGKTPQRRP